MLHFVQHDKGLNAPHRTQSHVTAPAIDLSCTRGVVCVLWLSMLEKILSFYTRSFALWVILGGLVAYLWPAPLASLDRGR